MMFIYTDEQIKPTMENMVKNISGLPEVGWHSISKFSMKTYDKLVVSVGFLVRNQHFQGFFMNGD